jgi:hypothetical protein
MTAATSDRMNVMVAPILAECQCGITAAETLYMNTMACPVTATGYLVAAGVGVTGPVCGVVKSQKANTATGAADGDVSADLLQGVFEFANDAVHPVTALHFGQRVYAADDQTVGHDSALGPLAGVCVGLTAAGKPLVAIDAAANRVMDDTSITSLLTDATSPHGIIDLSTRFRLATGAPMAIFADGDTPVPGLVVDGGESCAFRWANDATHDQVATSFILPEDLDTAHDAIVTIRCYKTGATNNAGNTTTFAVSAFNQVLGAFYDADADYGGATDAVDPDAVSKTIQEVTRTLAAADLPAAGNSVTILFDPSDGTLVTDDISVCSVQVKYTKKLTA